MIYQTFGGRRFRAIGSVVLAALVGGGFAAATARAADSPEPRRGEVRFEPAADEARTPEPFRLAEHRFAFEERFGGDGPEGIEVSEVTFPSPVQTPFTCNNTVHCEFYRPQRAGRRPAVVVLHILGGDFPLARLFCHALAQHGTAALFVKMPYYGPRRPATPRKRMIADDPHETVAGLRQAVLDIRRGAAWLAAHESVDPERIGIFGISLGGITAALASEHEPRFCNVCLMLAGGDLAKVTWESKELRRVREKWEAGGGTVDQFYAVLRPVDPLTHAERLRGRRLLMLNARNDEVIPPACTESLWRAVGEPRIVWYDAGHYSAAGYLLHGLVEVAKFFADEGPNE